MPHGTMQIGDIQLTRDSLERFAAYLASVSIDPQSIRLLADLDEEASSAELWMKYIVGSAVVLGSVDECALRVIHKHLSSGRLHYLSKLLEELATKNDSDTVAHFIAENAREEYWDYIFRNLITELVDNNWDTVRPLFTKTLAILRESKDKSKDYGAMVRRMPIGFQYERISSGQVPLDEIDKVYLPDEPPYSLLREIFFRARCSHNRSPQIREHIAERVPWFKQFMHGTPSNAVDASSDSSVEPSHDVWTRIRRFVDAETLIFVWRLVCSTWNERYFKTLAEEIGAQELLLQDLGHVRWNRIHTIAPWNHFLKETNSAVYMGRCIINGALGRTKLDERSNQQIIQYLHAAVVDIVPVSQSSKESARCESFAKLIEEGYKAYPCEIPRLREPSSLTAEGHEKVIHDLVCQKKLVVGVNVRWIVGRVSRIYSVLGKDQIQIQGVIDLSVDDYRKAFFIWIMIGQACGMTEDTARSVFDKPGTFTQKFIRPVVVEPSEYYDFIADSGMLFEMVDMYYKTTVYDPRKENLWSMYELNCLMVSLILFFKGRPDKIERIVVSMASQLPTLREDILRSMKAWFGRETECILTRRGEYPPEDVEFVKGVLTRCGLL